MQVKVNVDVIFLDSEEHNKIESFHNKVFLDVLGVKDFIIRSYSNEDNSYLIVPIYSIGLIFYNTFIHLNILFSHIQIIIENKYEVDWSVIDINKFVETDLPTMEQRESKFYEEYLKTTSVISPWYRNIVPIQVII